MYLQKGDSRMEFRPCVDIHNGKVKQIVGGSLIDQGDFAKENYVATQDAAFFANLYKSKNIKGGHIILLNPVNSEYYEATKHQAMEALQAYPGGMQVGGGINPKNAEEFLDAGASHVIVTSYVFQNGKIHYDRLDELVRAVGKEHLVLDLSCKKTENGYRIVTDRWQKITLETVTDELIHQLSECCDEFLLHAVDVEGKANGIEEELVTYLGHLETIPITYAGGVHSYEDLKLLKDLGRNKVNVTVGSALDLFGGPLKWTKILEICS